MPEEFRSPSQGPSQPNPGMLSQAEMMHYRTDWLQKANKIMSLAKGKTEPILNDQGEAIERLLHINLPNLVLGIGQTNENDKSLDRQLKASNKIVLSIVLYPKLSPESGDFIQALIMHGGQIKIEAFYETETVDETNKKSAEQISALLSDVLNHPAPESLFLDPDLEQNEIDALFGR